MPLVSDLEARIDEAIVIARASERGVREVGEMALDAARQARRAAEAAESSAHAAAAAVRAPRTAPARAADARQAPPPSREIVIDPLQRFNERADALVARLRALQQLPL